MRKPRSRRPSPASAPRCRDAAIYVYDNNSTRPHPRGRGRGRRDRPHREDAGQGPCRAAHVRRRRGRHLCDGRRRCDLRRRRRAGAGRASCSTSSSTWSSAPASPRSSEAYRRGHVLGNKLFTGLLVQPVRPQLQRHLLRLPRLLAPLRQELPGAVARLRDRDRDQRPRAGARHAGRRDGDRLRRAPRRLGVQALAPIATAGGS